MFADADRINMPLHHEPAAVAMWPPGSCCCLGVRRVAAHSAPPKAAVAEPQRAGRHRPSAAHLADHVQQLLVGDHLLLAHVIALPVEGHLRARRGSRRPSAPEAWMRVGGESPLGTWNPRALLPATSCGTWARAGAMHACAHLVATPCLHMPVKAVVAKVRDAAIEPLDGHGVFADVDVEVVPAGIW